MLKNNPKSLIQRALISTDRQKLITEYFKSKFENNQIKKYPESDVAKSGPEIELLKACRELSQNERELEAKHEEYVEKRKFMNQQWNEMRRKESLLRESFIKFDNFVKENYEKRLRAQRKINEEKERQKIYENQISELEGKLTYLAAIRDKMQKYVKDYNSSQIYLESVVNKIEEFQSINQIFNRYESLMEVRQNLAEHQNKDLHTLEEIGIEMQRMTEGKGHTLISLNNQLATLQSRYDRVKVEALKWESAVSRIKSTSAEKTLELIRIRLACWNLYTQMCKRKGIPTDVSKNDIENQLVHIKRTIAELKRIVKTAKKRYTKANKSVNK
ncbi:coiled-coil domain-containing protein 42 homolog [Microplitis demolitor]|uniref:coiled-coil domain-containing protein 42 homolog n=1 Tax=Microplitis demolitor TaxID=69319 RepID=UPI0004CD09A8|nr:coiled-coil domain-containing protein 42 homolog [Microplitis demolitor]